MGAMGDGGNEPSMEHILSSIKRIIAEDGDVQTADRRDRRQRVVTGAAQPPVDDDGPSHDVLELNEAIDADAGQPSDAIAEDAIEEGADGLAPIASADTVVASKNALDTLSRLVVKPDVAGSDTLEGMVREMLRPMLAEWLDEHLPRVVDTLVAREIARITGR